MCKADGDSIVNKTGTILVFIELISSSGEYRQRKRKIQWSVMNAKKINHEKPLQLKMQ